MARIQEIRDAIATYLRTVTFSVPVTVKSSPIAFADIENHPLPTIYVSEIEHARETRVTRGHTRRQYKLVCSVIGFINTYTYDQYATLSQTVLDELEGVTMSGAKQTTIGDGAGVAEYDFATNENQNVYQAPLEIEYEEYKEG